MLRSFITHLDLIGLTVFHVYRQGRLFLPAGHRVVGYGANGPGGGQIASRSPDLQNLSSRAGSSNSTILPIPCTSADRIEALRLA
jgi:hypothetical protein